MSLSCAKWIYFHATASVTAHIFVVSFALPVLLSFSLSLLPVLEYWDDTLHQWAECNEITRKEKLSLSVYHCMMIACSDVLSSHQLYFHFWFTQLFCKLIICLRCTHCFLFHILFGLSCILLTLVKEWELINFCTHLFNPDDICSDERDWVIVRTSLRHSSLISLVPVSVKWMRAVLRRKMLLPRGCYIIATNYPGNKDARPGKSSCNSSTFE